MSNQTLTLGSLFDGSGGFPLGASRHGVKPVWASEIEPDPIRVTKKNFPDMKHYGDIRKMNGAEIEPVDIIAAGSPCNQLSRAGERTGLHSGQSQLFFEAIRVIKEMRDATNGEYPKYILWENVPNAFNSGNGEDFRTVLEEFVQIKKPDITIPKPDKWDKAGYIMGEDYSISWRLLDAQYWGVPQRRKRIYVVFDLGGRSAPEILFKPEVCSRDSESNRGTEKADARNSDKSTAKLCEKYPLNFNPTDSRLKFEKDGIVQTLTARMGTGGNYVPLILMASEHSHAEISENLCPTLLSAHVQPIMAYQDKDELRIRKLTPLECCRLQGFPDDWCDGVEVANPSEDDVSFWRSVFNDVGRMKSDSMIERWLKTPMSNTARYKMWGNGVALPCVERVFQGIEDYVYQ